MIISIFYFKNIHIYEDNQLEHFKIIDNNQVGISNIENQQLKIIYGHYLYYNHTYYKLYELWVILSKLSSTYKFSYMLAYGSLLGYFRHKSIIPYDEDNDVHIGIETANRLINMANSNLKWCIFTNQIKTELFDKYKFILLVHNKSINSKTDKQNRYNCKGKLTSIHNDSCGFIGPFARLIIKSDKYYHTDFFLWNGINSYKKDGIYINIWDKCVELPPLEKGLLNNIPVYVPKYNNSIYLKTMYGKNYLIPNNNIFAKKKSIYINN
jgi:hypothetical protein